MNKVGRILCLLALVPLLILGTAKVALAAPIFAGYEVWDTRNTDDNKSWIIKFNKSVAADTVNDRYIYVTDVENRPVSVTLSASSNGEAVMVRPEVPYRVGQEYRLYITSSVCARGLDGQRGESLSKPQVLPFIIKAQGGYIINISHNYHRVLTSITVQTSQTVHFVSANNNDMIPQGNNVFKGTLPGLTIGDKVFIKAHDGSGNLLVVEEYTIG